MTITRRALLGSSLVAGASLVAKHTAAQPAGPQPATPAATAPGHAPARPPQPGNTPPVHAHADPHATDPHAADSHVDAHTGVAGHHVVVPNGSLLPFTVRHGIKIFHLRAVPIQHQIAPGLDIEAWGYNGVSPGPVLEAVVGDRVRVYVTNQLPEPTSIHWHGLFIPNGMDGVAGLTQDAIAPGKTFRYEFTFDRAGTFMYHPHADEMTQIALGMMGMIVVHPRAPEPRRVRDYALMTHEWKIPIGTRRADPLAMNDFNVLTFNGKAFPATAPLVAERGDLIRIRLANLGPMDHHPIHIHGHAFELVATDGGPVPTSARIPETTILVPVGTTRTIELVARALGDWPLHCHMTHHAMNQMGHDAANLIGADTRGLDAQLGRVVPGAMTMGKDGMGEMAAMRMTQPANSITMLGGTGRHGTIDMGGMFTLVKIREHLTGDGDPGWYEPPADVASEATPDELARDGIVI
ncbi:MAG TPA: multicopper oxidase domain-containing protein [Kofleriaceae bacterium]|nr:multicopper oxidase domain-containing protein [Kofleriaceae bacterium]